MINRKIVLYLMLLAIIVGGAPYFTGMLVETKFQDVVKVISDSDTVPVVVEVTEYKRGWRKSFAKTRVTFFLEGSNAQLDQYSLIVEHEIRHGPFVQLKEDNYREWDFARALIHSSLLINDEAKKILVEELGHTELFNINSVMTMDGIVRVNLEGQPLKLKEHVGTDRMAWKGLDGQWELSSDLKHLTGKLVIPGLDIDLNGVHYTAGDFTYQTDLTKSPQGLWPGKFLANLDKLTVNNPLENITLQIEGLTTGGMMVVEAQMTDFSGTLRIEKMQVNNKQYGPINYTNTLKNVDARVVKSLLVISHKLNTQGQSQSGANLQMIMTLLPDFLKSRPEFTIDPLHIHTEQGDVNAALSIAVGSLQAANLNKINDVIQSVVAKATLSVPKVVLRDILSYQYSNKAQPTDEAAKQALMQQVDQKVTDTIAKWLKENILIEKGEYYLCQADLQQGKVNINGKAVDLSHPTTIKGQAPAH